MPENLQGFINNREYSILRKSYKNLIRLTSKGSMLLHFNLTRMWKKMSKYARRFFGFHSQTIRNYSQTIYKLGNFFFYTRNTKLVLNSQTHCGRNRNILNSNKVGQSREKHPSFFHLKKEQHINSIVAFGKVSGTDLVLNVWNKFNPKA